MDLSNINIKFEHVLDALNKQLSTIKAGRANPHVLDNIFVDVYGQSMPINQIANINVVDSNLISIQPWDKSNIDAIKKAILQSDLGISPIVDGTIIKLPIPVLTEERRKGYVKLMKSKIEESKISVRQVRKELIDEYESMKKNKLITEDDFDTNQKKIQALVDKYNIAIEDIGKEKEKELMTV
jgi:ribosome recycling factor